MAEIRQYIGARYVFKIYENSQDPSSAEWEPNVTFEPLTIVTYLNSTYASKKDVPGSVGNPAANPLYWVVTGAYNGQIATLQNQIDTLNNTVIPAIQNDIDTLKNAIDNITTTLDGDILVVFDSYGTTYGNPAGDTTTIADVMQSLTSRNIRSFSVSGGGFVRDTGNGTFYSNLVTYLATLSDDDKSKITDIVVAAGRNDWTASSADLETAMNTFYSYAASNLPNLARKYFGYIANGDNNSVHGTKNEQYACYMNFYNSCNNLNISWLKNVDCVLHNYELLNSDGVHPSVDGKKELAKALIQALDKGYTCSYPIKVLSMTAETGITISTTGSSSPVGQMINNIASIRMPSFIKCTLSAAIDNALPNINLFSFDDGYIKYPYGYVDLPCTVAYIKNDMITPLAGRVMLDRDGVVKYIGYVPSGNRTDNISEILLLGCGDININGAEG